jgi:hypothetical protein
MSNAPNFFNNYSTRVNDLTLKAEQLQRDLDIVRNEIAQAENIRQNFESLDSNYYTPAISQLVKAIDLTNYLIHNVSEEMGRDYGQELTTKIQDILATIGNQPEMQIQPLELNPTSDPDPETDSNPDTPEPESHQSSDGYDVVVVDEDTYTHTFEKLDTPETPTDTTPTLTPTSETSTAITAPMRNIPKMYNLTNEFSVVMRETKTEMFDILRDFFVNHDKIKVVESQNSVIVSLVTAKYNKSVELSHNAGPSQKWDAIISLITDYTINFHKEMLGTAITKVNKPELAKVICKMLDSIDEKGLRGPAR